jgi:hypothetical protein
MENTFGDPKKVQTINQVNDVYLVFTSDVYDGVKSDTKLEINGAYICWISAESIEPFTQGFSELMQEHRI